MAVFIAKLPVTEFQNSIYYGNVKLPIHQYKIKFLCFFPFFFFFWCVNLWQSYELPSKQSNLLHTDFFILKSWSPMLWAQSFPNILLPILLQERFFYIHIMLNYWCEHSSFEFRKWNRSLAETDTEAARIRISDLHTWRFYRICHISCGGDDSLTDPRERTEKSAWAFASLWSRQPRRMYLLCSKIPMKFNLCRHNTVSRG